MKKIGDIIITLLFSFMVFVVYCIYWIHKFITDKEFRKLVIYNIRWDIKDIEYRIERKIRA